MRFFLIALLFAGCMKQNDSTNGGEYKVTPEGQINFSVGVATIQFERPMALPDGSPFMLESVTFDRNSMIVYTKGKLLPLDGSNGPPIAICTLSRAESFTRMNDLQKKFEQVHVCRVHAVGNIAVPLVYYIEQAYVTDIYGGRHSAPVGYTDNQLDICSYDEVKPIADALASDMDFSQAMSCVPLWGPPVGI